MSDDHVIEEERGLGPMLIQAIDDKIALKKRAAELKKALAALCNEVSGILSLGELAMREAVGHTNVNCLRTRLEEAQSALKPAGASEGRQPEPSPASISVLSDDQKADVNKLVYRINTTMLAGWPPAIEAAARAALTPSPSPTPVQGGEEALERLVSAARMVALVHTHQVNDGGKFVIDVGAVGGVWKNHGAVPEDLWIKAWETIREITGLDPSSSLPRGK